MDSLFEQFANISKAGAYDIVAQQRDELVKELEAFKNTFYLNVCRAYNAGKQNALEMVAENKEMGESLQSFKSSHDYFKTEFPEFKTNVP